MPDPINAPSDRFEKLFKTQVLDHPKTTVAPAAAGRTALHHRLPHGLPHGSAWENASTSTVSSESESL